MKAFVLTSKENNSKKSEESPTFKTDSSIPVQRVYSPTNSRTDYNRQLGEPGSFPYTRGIYPEMYRQKLWTMRQYSGFGSASDTNKRFKYLLNAGQSGLSVAFDLPTQLGFDSDSPRAKGEVGKVGVAISTLENMETLFEGLPIDHVSTSMTINATASTMLSMYIVAAEARGVPRSALSGTTQNDMLKEYAARNTYIFPPDNSFNLCVDIITFCSKQMPRWHPISISGYHIREAGANAIQELAYTFANAIEYVNSVVARGLPVDEFCDKLSFFFACRNDFVEEIAKFRASRRMWAKIVRDKFGSRNQESMKLKFHAQTSGETLSAQQPQNNVVRVTIQAMAAVLGGVQSLHTNSYDEALGLPTEDAVTIALRTQQIIAEESNITKTIDPVGGSYYLEGLTDEIESRATEELEKVLKLGGALGAIKSGYIQNEIQKSAYAFQKEVDSNQRVIVGVNKYARSNKGGKGFRALRVSRASETQQLRSLRKFKASRNKEQVEGALSRLEEEAARDPSSRRRNLVELILEATKSKATTGEISNALRQVYGEYRPRSTL